MPLAPPLQYGCPQLGLWPVAFEPKDFIPSNWGFRGPPVIPHVSHDPSLQPVQQPIPYFSNSIQFRHFYTHKLRGLAENSKPAIHALLMIAQDFVGQDDPLASLYPGIAGYYGK